jgi:hypothetical protein
MVEQPADLHVSPFLKNINTSLTQLAPLSTWLVCEFFIMLRGRKGL